VGRAAGLNTPVGRPLAGQLYEALRDDKFARDLSELVARLSRDLPPDLKDELVALAEKLVWLHEEGRVKINHSAMELVCARDLLAMGYSVDVEHELNGLVCDIYAELDGEGLVVEIETGFVPPEHALDPLTYCRARIASKIARYGCLADRFALGLPPHYVAIVPPAFLKEGALRSQGELEAVKRLCDYYYRNPPVSLEEVRAARLDWIIIIDVDSLSTTIMNPGAYVDHAAAFLKPMGLRTT